MDELPRNAKGSLLFLFAVAVPPRISPAPPPPDETPANRSVPLSLELLPNMLSKGFVDGVLSNGLVEAAAGAPNGSVLSYGAIVLLPPKPGKPESGAVVVCGAAFSAGSEGIRYASI